MVSVNIWRHPELEDLEMVIYDSIFSKKNLRSGVTNSVVIQMSVRKVVREFLLTFHTKHVV